MLRYAGGAKDYERLRRETTRISSFSIPGRETGFLTGLGARILRNYPTAALRLACPRLEGCNHVCDTQCLSGVLTALLVVSFLRALKRRSFSAICSPLLMAGRTGKFLSAQPSRMEFTAFGEVVRPSSSRDEHAQTSRRASELHGLPRGSRARCASAAWSCRSQQPCASCA